MGLLNGLVGKRVGLALVALWVGQASFAQVVALYTNAPDGAVVMLSSDASITNTGTDYAAGIVFGNDGTGSGEIRGAGNLDVYRGEAGISGIYAESVILSQYIGAITVNAVSSNSSAGASGINVDWRVDSDISGIVSATAISGVALSSTSSVNVGAGAGGIYGNVAGNINGTVSANAIGGSAESSSSYADADAHATGIQGQYGSGVYNIFGVVTASATGGSALNSTFSANGRAEAIGINGKIDGGVFGDVSANATGGVASGIYRADAIASSRGIEGNVFGDIPGGVVANATGGRASVTSTLSDAAVSGASAWGILGNVSGNISGDVFATGIGGYASGESDARASAGAYVWAIKGNVLGNISGRISANATAGRSSVSFIDEFADSEANVWARGILGDFLIGDVSGDISASAIGGIATGVSDADASADAVAVYATTVIISNYTGSILASAIAGKEAGHISSAYACGIRSGNMGSLYLNAPTGSIHAVIGAPDGYASKDLANGSAAYSIFGGLYSNDTVRLGNVDIVGDIDLRGGTNWFEIFGNARIEGDVAASGGLNDFNISSGLLMPGGSVRVSDLLNRRLNIDTDGGFAFDLYENPSDTRNPKLMVDGQVLAPNGASIAAYAADGQTAQKIVGNSYEVVTATNGIDGTFVENVKSLFELDIVVGETNIVITPTGIKGQVGENTPTGNGVTQASIASANRAINSLSQHAGAIRSMLRNGSAPQAGNAPQGAAGPSLARQELTSGEWATFVRQLNDMGSQDSEGGIAGYDWNSSGFLIGFEKLVGDGLVVGTSGGGSWTDLDGLDGSGGGASEMFVGSVFLNAFSETWYSEAGLSYAHAWNDAERIASDSQRYMGEYESDLFGGWLEFGYTLAGDKYSVEPYGRGTYLNGQHNGYTDKGGTNPLTVDSSTSDNLLTELGVRTIRDWRLANNNRLRTTVKAGWQCELMNDTITANGTLLGASQRLTCPEADRNALVLGINADWQLTDKVFIVFDYEPTLSGNRFNHSVIGEIKVVF